MMELLPLEAHVRSCSSCKYVVAIPSRGRATELCQQTLPLLRYHGVPMIRVHVFVHKQEPTNAETLSDYDAYKVALEKHGFHDVCLCPGAANLQDQWNLIWDIFPEGAHIIVFSDTVPGLKWKTLDSPCTMYDLPQGYLRLLIAHAYDLMMQGHSAAWGLCPCKNPKNMRAKTVGWNLGLLDGNCFGVLNCPSVLHMEGNRFTPDVELTLRLWSVTPKLLRYHCFTAEHKYNSRGGQKALVSLKVRRQEERTSFKQYMEQYPRWIRLKPRSLIQDLATATQACKFIAVGGHATSILPNGIVKSTGGRPLVYGCRSSSGQRKHQQRHPKTSFSMRKPAGAQVGNENAMTRRRARKRKLGVATHSAVN
jgi:hypothetical protein